MADNQQTASDDVGGVQYPRVKVTWGTDGVAADVSANDPLPVALNGGDPLPVVLTGDDPIPVVLSDGLLGKVQILKADGVTIVDPVPAGPAAAATSTPVTSAKDDIRHVDVVLKLATGPLGPNTIVAAPQVVTGCFKAADAQGVLQSLVLIDADGQKANLDIYFFNADIRIGDQGALPSIAAADAASILGHVGVLDPQYVSLGGVAVATVSGLGLAVRSGAGAADMWVAVVNGSGSPTYSANGLTLRVGVIG